MIVSGSLRTGLAESPGGEQAANALRPADGSRHTTTLDVKVRGPIAASLLVTGRPYLFHTAELAILVGEVLEAGGRRPPV
jgi:hypothetical protein